MVSEHQSEFIKRNLVDNKGLLKASLPHLRVPYVDDLTVLNKVLAQSFTLKWSPEENLFVLEHLILRGLPFRKDKFLHSYHLYSLKEQLERKTTLGGRSFKLIKIPGGYGLLQKEGNVSVGNIEDNVFFFENLNQDLLAHLRIVESSRLQELEVWKESTLSPKT